VAKHEIELGMVVRGVQNACRIKKANAVRIQVTVFILCSSAIKVVRMRPVIVKREIQAHVHQGANQTFRYLF
jgi:hypothetical protein